MADLTLYFMDTCPYCHKVLDFMRSQGIEIPLKNLKEDPSYSQELIDIGGKKQVPALVIDGKALYESDTIIEWLSTHRSEI